ncbi:hypothetical protein ACFQ48_07450 [Hymenobacter caeli]|uniref:Outer membrane protein beta-barrel domain-containing protein n=1 Tax=Hymenobacter caeli TaxID=2735894 RepID=A0ABX2FMM2_9BACT|nr:hypothetical protein [Hymenobacter caeli]NRT18078.1 hypothetical protein [Hymenobacter caeli]
MIPNNFTPPPPDAEPPKGSLEELFRHHLADAKATPRPLVWEQLDNALLVRQNETYRRRLVATRWVAAASLLVASFAGADWWARHALPAPAATVATSPAGANGRPGRTPADAAVATGLPPATAPDRTAPRAAVGGGLALSGPAGSVAAGSVAAGSVAAGSVAAGSDGPKDAVTLRASADDGTRSPGRPGFVPSVAATRPAGSVSSQASSLRANEAAAPGQLTSMAGSNSAAQASNQASRGSAAAGAAGAYSSGAYAAPTAYASAGNALTDGPIAVARAEASGAAGPRGAWVSLALRPAALAPAAPGPALPARLAAAAAVPNVAALPLRRWQFGASYAAGVFHPNADFSQDAAPTATAYAYSPAALRTSSQTLNNRAAAEYRANLRGGLDQRVSLRATRLLGGHWALSTGLELGQHEAQSATTTSFVGEQLADYAFAATPPATLRTTSFRYRTAGVPVAVHYANPVKRGWSAYGRLGAAVSALFNVRSEVAGEPEATKTYSLTTGSPYRRLLTTLRGGAGAQYRPATGRCTLSVGPTAELGVLSLNAQPMQDFVRQSRPYSFGLEATVDFGGTVKMP